MAGLIGKKIGMTSIFDDQGKNVPCTVIEAGPCVVTQIKTEDTDGYNSIQIGFGDKKEKKCSKSEMGHLNKSKSSAKKKYVEFPTFKIKKTNAIFLTQFHTLWAQTPLYNIFYCRNIYSFKYGSSRFIW